MDRAAARKKLGFDDGMCILSFGGSLGAGCINEAMAKVIPWHTEKGMAINHIHGYGGMGKESFPNHGRCRHPHEERPAAHYGIHQ